MNKKLHNVFLDWKELFRPGSFDEFENLSNCTFDEINKKPVSWEKTLFLSELCRLSYIHDSSLRKEVLKGFGLEEQLSFSKKGSEFLLLSNNSSNSPVNICCFIGTNDIFDYLNILTFGTVDWNEKGSIYKGFKKSFDNIEDSIREISSSVGNQKIWLVGHSLGGVLAILSSFYFKNPEINVFGLPKIGDEKFVKHVKEQEPYHVCLENDFITGLPLFINKFKPVVCKTIPSKIINNKTCPSKIYSHAPIHYSENIKIMQHNKQDK